ncbi:MAG: DUF6912 family protein [Actinomycetes bacterium]
MRVYLPATLGLLAAVYGRGAYRLPPGLSVHAVTPALREWYTEGDVEELEYAALLDAAASSLRALADDEQSPRRRVVLAADVDDSSVRPGQGETASVVLLDEVQLRDVVSVHVDEREAEDDVRAAVAALPAAEAGDEEARFVVDEADGHDLLWYDVTEIGDLVGDVAGEQA